MIILEIHWQHHLPNLLLHQEITTKFYVQNNLRVLSVNFRSYKNKVPQIENLLTSSKQT